MESALAERVWVPHTATTSLSFMRRHYRHADKKVNRRANCILGDNGSMIYEPAKITERRKELKWTQQELGRRAGLSQATISDLEKGMAHVKAITLTNVAAALGIPLKEMMRVRVSTKATDQDFDDAMSIALALDAATRSAWIAAGKALLSGGKKK